MGELLGAAAGGTAAAGTAAAGSMAGGGGGLLGMLPEIKAMFPHLFNTGEGQPGGVQAAPSGSPAVPPPTDAIGTGQGFQGISQGFEGLNARPRVEPQDDPMTMLYSLMGIS